MGYIREPENIDLMVAPSTFTVQDRLIISTIIANYKIKSIKSKAKK